MNNIFIRMFLRIILLLVLNYEFTQCLDSCGEWTQVKDNLCVKVLEKKATEEDALKSCAQLDSSSSLVIIHDKPEQEFLNNLLQKYNNISENVWIGLKYKTKGFEWSDGTPLDYTNWGDDALRDGSLGCAQMSLEKSSLGKWTDQSCKKTALVVCQKNNEFNDLRKTVENLVKLVDRQQLEIKALKTASVVPISFIYTQLPNQTAPELLWPNTKWTEVTQQYSGLFFRAEGTGSLPFGQVQQANYSKISDITAWSSEMESWRDDHLHGPLNLTLSEGKWTELKPGGFLYWLKFYMTAAEPRPRNTSVKIWKRTN